MTNKRTNWWTPILIGLPSNREHTTLGSCAEVADATEADAPCADWHQRHPQSRGYGFLERDDDGQSVFAVFGPSGHRSHGDDVGGPPIARLSDPRSP